MQPTGAKSSYYSSLLQAPGTPSLDRPIETWAGMKIIVVPISIRSLDAHKLACSKVWILEAQQNQYFTASLPAHWEYSSSISVITT